MSLWSGPFPVLLHLTLTLQMREGSSSITCQGHTWLMHCRTGINEPL